MATASPLDQATRDSIIAQAKTRAATSGKSAEQELYDYGTSQGFDAAGIDTAMGFGAGTTSGWAQKNVPNYQSNTGILSQASTPATPTAQPTAQPAAGNWGAMPTEADRTSIIAQANDRAKASGGSVTGEMVKYANGIGMPLDVAEQRMGYAPGILSGAGQPAATPAATTGAPGASTAPATQGAGNPAANTPATPKTYTALDPTTRASIVQQAQDRAKASGKTPEQELWDYAKSEGIPPEGVDTLMGFPPGTTANWMASNGGNGGQPAIDPTSLGLPATWRITPDQTVEGRINNLTDPNNPLIAQARSRALQNMNGRGLLNSSIAMGAADSAAYDAALPIATADAATAAKAASYNADQQNVFSIKNMDNATNRYGIDVNAATQRESSRLSADTQRFTSQLSADTQKLVAGLNNESQAMVSKAHDENAQILQNSQGASQAYQAYATSLNHIQNNNNMSAEAKAAAIQTATTAFNNAILGYRSAGAGIPDISQLLGGSAPVDPATSNPATSPPATQMPTGILSQPYTSPNYDTRG